ncbi:MAG TPA: serine/threonine-protein kinase, partial [Gemmataceae bacterium]|nr:serine/threonine-protein kinase [Gemmataceae bacterium]
MNSRVCSSALSAPPPKEPASLAPDKTVVLVDIPLPGPERKPHKGVQEEKPFPSIAGYEIVMELGRGGMGVVYLARQIDLKRLVALKVILAGNHASPKELARFRSEAEAVARLQHPSIVQIHDIGEQDGLPYFSLEYVAGGSLDKRMDGSMPEPRSTAQLMAVLARAVHYAHQRGIIHRDLKPSNILLTADGAPKITDFSLAKLLDNDTSLTPTDAVIGTPNYMSPEQAAGHTRDAGPAADIFSLGAILYELLAGRPPFKGTTLLDTLEQLRTREAIPAARFRAHLPSELDIITLKCLEKNPEKRYPSALALAQDLERFLAGHSIQARRTPAWVHLVKWARRRPAAAGLVGMVLVILISLVATVPRYRHLAVQASRQQSQQQYRAFIRLRDQALFHGMMAGSSSSLFTGTDCPDQVKQAAASATEALHLAGVYPEEGRIDLVHFPDVPADQIQADCYTLLLVDADATAAAAR